MDHLSVEDRAYAESRPLVLEDDRRPCVRCGCRIAEGFRGLVRLMATASTLDAYQQMTRQPEDVFAKSRCLCFGCFEDLLRFLANKPEDSPRRLLPDETERLTLEERAHDSVPSH